MTFSPIKTRRSKPNIERGVGHVLLVDDEELVRSSTRRLLKKLGFTVYLANDGRTALDIYREKGDLISLVILDMVMPEADGYETFKGLVEIDPHVRVLLCSGYAKNETIEGLLSSGALGFLEKPFDLGTLSTELNNLLH